MYVRTKAIIISALLLPFSALAGEANIIDVQVSKTSKDTYRFDVTVRAHDFIHQYGGKTITVDLP
ncbi:hypothetical protein [Vibrio sp. VB16]|uniref:hypothetical protein n=1 Tax=Vibrio sp. VB16 TaxID=2785746 RepID=UPI0018A05126|nr:hypothetical protein [Vibrio sp. VB16]UGA56496.1 hypothetical protein IUZ65_020045 [Vibrio sp. VB16]